MKHLLSFISAMLLVSILTIALAACELPFGLGDTETTTAAETTTTAPATTTAAGTTTAEATVTTSPAATTTTAPIATTAPIVTTQPVTSTAPAKPPVTNNDNEVDIGDLFPS